MTIKILTTTLLFLFFSCLGRKNCAPNCDEPSPPPVITEFSAQNSIVQGENVQFKVAGEHIDSCEISAGEEKVVEGFSIADAVQHSPAEDTQYKLVCSGPGGQVEAFVEVKVFGVPSIENFSADPRSVVDGNPVSFSVDAKNVDSCKILINGEDGFDFNFGNTNAHVPTGKTEYRLVCTGPGGNIESIVEVTVLPLPKIGEFKVEPPNVVEGNPVTFTVSGAENVDSCKVLIDGEEGFDFDFGGSNTHVPTKDSQYTLVCTGPGGSVEASSSVGFSSKVDFSIPFADAHFPLVPKETWEQVCGPDCFVEEQDQLPKTPPRGEKIEVESISQTIATVDMTKSQVYGTQSNLPPRKLNEMCRANMPSDLASAKELDLIEFSLSIPKERKTRTFEVETGKIVLASKLLEGTAIDGIAKKGSEVKLVYEKSEIVEIWTQNYQIFNAATTSVNFSESELRLELEPVSLGLQSFGLLATSSLPEEQFPGAYDNNFFAGPCLEAMLPKRGYGKCERCFDPRQEKCEYDYVDERYHKSALKRLYPNENPRDHMFAYCFSNSQPAQVKGRVNTIYKPVQSQRVVTEIDVVDCKALMPIEAKDLGIDVWKREMFISAYITDERWPNCGNNCLSLPRVAPEKEVGAYGTLEPRQNLCVDRWGGFSWPRYLEVLKNECKKAEVYTDGLKRLAQSNADAAFASECGHQNNIRCKTAVNAMKKLSDQFPLSNLDKAITLEETSINKAKAQEKSYIIANRYFQEESIAELESLIAQVEDGLDMVTLIHSQKGSTWQGGHEKLRDDQNLDVKGFNSEKEALESLKKVDIQLKKMKALANPEISTLECKYDLSGTFRLVEEAIFSEYKKAQTKTSDAIFTTQSDLKVSN